MRENLFNIGDLVELKSNGPVMTVFTVCYHTDNIDYTDEKGFAGKYVCSWFAGKKLDRGTFPEESLVLVKSEEKKSTAK